MAFDDVNDLSRRRSYTATAGQTVFTVPFTVFAATDVIVVVDGVAQTVNTNYTVSGLGDVAGSTVTLTTPLAGGETVVIYSDTEIERGTDFEQNGRLRSADLNLEFNRIMVMLQELTARVNRSIRASMLQSAVNEMPPPESVANKFLFFNSAGAPSYVTGDPTQPVTVISEVAYPTDGQTVITLDNSYTPGAGNLGVYLNGVRMVPGVDYTESTANTITLTEAADLGDVIVFAIGEVFDVTLAKTAKTSQNITATEGQLTLTTTTSYTPGADEIEVFLNGALLSPGVDYSETNATTITMTSALADQDQVRILFGQGYNPVDTSGTVESLALRDGVAAPSAVSGRAIIYIDNADGDLKVKFSDGIVKTLATDT